MALFTQVIETNAVMKNKHQLLLDDSLPFADFSHLRVIIMPTKNTDMDWREFKTSTLNLEELFDSVAVNKERITFTYQDKVFLAAVPIEDANVIKQLENCVESMTLKVSGETLPELGDLLAHVTKARMILTYQKVFLVVVPIEEDEIIEQLEDCIDNANADDALKEEGSISLDNFRKELGL